MSGDAFDAIVVGAGPAGSACAYTLAKAGLSVLVLERGEFPGSKNIFGGVLYTSVLNRLIPGFWDEAPVERHVVKRRFSILSGESDLSLEFRTEDFNRAEPYNNSYTCLRAKFDRWFAKKAEDAGAMIIPDTVVDDLLYKNGHISGVKARREGGDLEASVVIAADGVNSFLAAKAGLHKSPHSQMSMAVAVKELLELDRGVIEERFGLEGNEGVAMECFGGSVKGLVGGGFLYTNKDSLSLGLACTVEAMMEDKVNASDLLDDFKKHPMIKRFIRGSKPVEYAAHMIPEGGYNSISDIVTDGMLVVGDAAGFVNSSLYHEGTNLAMASGVCAAETVIEAKEKGDFSREGLKSYRSKLEASFVFNDLKKYRNFPEWAATNPKFFKEYPDMTLELMRDYFSISETPKSEIQKAIWQKFKKQTSVFRFGYDLYKFAKTLF